MAPTRIVSAQTDVPTAAATTAIVAAMTQAPNCVVLTSEIDHTITADVDVYLAPDGLATRVSNTVGMPVVLSLLHADYSRCGRNGSWIRVHVAGGDAILPD